MVTNTAIRFKAISVASKEIKGIINDAITEIEKIINKVDVDAPVANSFMTPPSLTVSVNARKYLFRASEKL